MSTYGTPVWFHPRSYKIQFTDDKSTVAERKKRNKKLKDDGFIYLASRLECETLVYLLGLVNLSEVTIHPRIELLPGIGLKGIDPINWDVDFLVNPVQSFPECEPFFVESKGFEQLDYKVKLNLFKRYRHEKLIVVKCPKDFSSINQHLNQSCN